MIILKELQKAEPVPCPYLSDRKFIQEYFFARDLSPEEWELYVSQGWRRFGLFFFRPKCGICRECRPIRIPVKTFKPSTSQRKVLSRNSDTQFEVKTIKELIQLEPQVFFSHLAPAFEVMKIHSKAKFNNDKEDASQFLENFYQPAVDSFQTEYVRDGRLVGVGYADRSFNGLSSLYFSYHPEFSCYSLGTFSVLREIDLCKEWGLDYYYLGYYIRECSRMSYKGRFLPMELYDWDSLKWIPSEG